MTTPTELPLIGRTFTFFRMTGPAKLTLALLAIAVSVATGCGAARPSKYYQLTVPADSIVSANSNTLPITLLIGRITAPALYREDQIVYSSGGESMGTYEYQKWSEPPTEMIAEIMLRQFRASGRYHGVYTLRSDIRGDFLLHGHLYDFKEVEGSPVVLSLLQDCVPAQASLSAFEDKKLEENAVLVLRQTPFFVVITNRQRVAGPGAADQVWGFGRHVYIV